MRRNTLALLIVAVLVTILGIAMLLLVLPHSLFGSAQVRGTPIASADTQAVSTNTPASTPTRIPSVTPANVLATEVPETPTIEDVGGPEGAELTVTAAFATLAAQATATAQKLDMELQSDAQTATAGASPAAVTAIAKAFTVQNDAGDTIGNGEVRLFAPASMTVNDLSEIRIEIQVNSPIVGSTLNPAPTATPRLGTPRPTPSPLPIADTQFVVVREFMGAGLRGVDIDDFKVVSVPPGGLRHMQANAINWWKWSISPKSQQVAGLKHLEVYIYLPGKLSDGTPFNDETNVIPFDINVASPAPNTVGQIFGMAWEQILGIAGLIATFGGAAATIYGVIRFLRERAATKKHPG